MGECVVNAILRVRIAVVDMPQMSSYANIIR